MGLSVADIEDIWSLLDYGLMSKAVPPAIIQSRVQDPECSPSTWFKAGESAGRDLYEGAMALGEELGIHGFESDDFAMVVTDFSGHTVSAGPNPGIMGM